MKFSLMIKLSLIGLAFAALNFLTADPTSAHGGRRVGKYELNVGFVAEPAYEGLMNGVDLRVEIAETEEPVAGVDQTLQVEVTHIASGVSKTLDLQPVKGEPGRYTADLIPTAPGEYRFRFFGAIEGLAVDEAFESGHDQFSAVESAKDLQIPEQQLELREVGSALRGSMDSTAQAQNSAAAATALASAGLALGAIGVLAGVGALVINRKRAPSQPAQKELPQVEEHQPASGVAAQAALTHPVSNKTNGKRLSD